MGEPGQRGVITTIEVFRKEIAPGLMSTGISDFVDSIFEQPALPAAFAISRIDRGPSYFGAREPELREFLPTRKARRFAKTLSKTFHGSGHDDVGAAV